MEFVDAPEYTNLSAVGMGGLVMPADERADLGILLTIRDGRAAVGWLKAEDPGLVGKFTTPSEHEDCFSFGTDWAVDADVVGSSHGNTDTIGAVLIGPGGPQFRFRGTKGNIGHTICIGPNGLTEETPLVAVKRWRIWASAAARDRANSRPLLEFVAP